MVTLKVGKHTVEVYDAIDELPIVRFQKYQKLLLIDAGVGGDINAFDQRLERAGRFLAEGKLEQAQKELANLRQNVFLIQNEISPQYRAFAVLVKSVDGKECGDISDDGLQRILELLKDAPVKDVTAPLDAVKKKIDSELRLYFPQVFADSRLKEYFDLMKARTVALLEGIVRGDLKPEKDRKVERLTTQLILFSNPGVFSGSESEEIKFDRNFEDVCLTLSEQLHVQPKNYTVLEFYNAFDFVQRRAKEAEKAKKRP